METQDPLESKEMPVGLVNLGNTCYLNSILQCLTYTPPLAEFCMLGLHKLQCGSGEDRMTQCPFCLLENRIMRSLENNIQVDKPQQIYQCLDKFAAHFKKGEQEDAHEFLRCAIDACDEVCIKLECNGFKALTSPTVMKDIFGAYLENQIQCMSCSSLSNRREPFMDLSLDIIQMKTLEEAIASFFQTETLEDDNRYSCDECKALTVAKKHIFIHQAPDVLVIHLKRFDGTSYGKISKYIEFKESLSLQSFMSKDSQDVAHYSLYAAVVHLGSQYDGHYYAYVKNSNGEWYCCDDKVVTEVDISDVLSEKVYILFYVRQFLRQEASPHQVYITSDTAPAKQAIPSTGTEKPCEDIEMAENVSGIEKLCEEIEMRENVSTVIEKPYEDTEMLEKVSDSDSNRSKPILTTQKRTRESTEPADYNEMKDRHFCTSRKSPRTV